LSNQAVKNLVQLIKKYVLMEMPVIYTHQIYNVHFIAVRTSCLVELHFNSVCFVLLTTQLKQQSCDVRHIWDEHGKLEM